MHVAPDPAALRPWFLPDQPGPLVGLHVVRTGHGTCFVDRWPEPRVVLAQTAENYELVGDPRNALSPQELQPLIAGFLAADQAFEQIVRRRCAVFFAPRSWPVARHSKAYLRRPRGSCQRSAPKMPWRRSARHQLYAWTRGLAGPQVDASLSLARGRTSYGGRLAARVGDVWRPQLVDATGG